MTEDPYRVLRGHRAVTQSRTRPLLVEVAWGYLDEWALRLRRWLRWG